MFGRPETLNENESKTKFEFSVRPFFEISESKSLETPLELSEQNLFVRRASLAKRTSLLGEQNILMRKELPRVYTSMYAKS